MSYTSVVTADTTPLIALSGLDPALAALGRMIGLLKPAGDGSYSVDPQWFADPAGNVARAVRDGGDTVAQLLEQVLGSVGGQALGVPAKDPGLLGTWYPIQSEAKQPTGLYLTAQAQDGKGRVFGLGVLHGWTVSGIAVKAWGMMPLLRLDGGVQVALAEPGNPITVGAAAESADGTPLVDIEGLSFVGAKVSAGLDIAAAAQSGEALSLSVVVLQLMLPGESEAKDRSLTDLEAIPAAEIQDTVAALFVAALAALAPSYKSNAAYLMPLLGLSTRVPGNDTALPSLAWTELLSRAVGGGDVGGPFRDWFRALTAEPAATKAWLSCVAGTLGREATVSGIGSRAAPFMVPMISLDGVGTLFLAIASEVGNDGLRRLYPGLNFRSADVALGGTPGVLRLAAALELAQFAVGTQSVGFGLPDSLDFNLGITLANRQNGQPLAAASGYSFGSLSAGLALAGVTPVPRLTLDDVATPDGSFASIDLLSPGALAQQAQETLIPMLSRQLDALLGLQAGTVSRFAGNAGALVGVTTPPSAGKDWPAGLAAPFSPARLAASLGDPLAALAEYYRKALTWPDPVAGHKAFTWMLQAAAAMLQDAELGGAAVAVSGEGTRADPWAATLSLKQESLPAALTAYTQAEGDTTRLVMGLRLAPEITLGRTPLVAAFAVDLLALDLKPSGDTAASWLPQAGIRVSLPDGFASDPVAGISVAIDSAELAAVWGRVSGWSCSLVAANPRMTVGGQTIALGQSLDFSDLQALRDLALKSVPAFLQMLTGVAGIALVRSNTRAGLTLAGVLGLVKDLGAAPGFPAGLTWPSLPTLQLTGLDDPWPALRRQIAANFASDDTARPVLSLLGWMLDPKAAAAPAITGSRQAADPFRVPIDGSGFDLLSWYQDDGQVLGLGVGRISATEAAGIGVSTALRLDAVAVSLASGAMTGSPECSLQCILARGSGAPLVDGGALGSLGALVLGVRLGLSGGAPVVTPVVVLRDVTLPGDTRRASLSLQDLDDPAFTDRLRQSFLALVNAGLQQAIAGVAGTAGFQTAYGLLGALGLALPRSGANDPYGINPAGWTALLADPTGYLRTRIVALLADETLRRQLFDLARDLLGLKSLPTLHPGAAAVLEVLHALGLVQDADHGYAPDLPALIALAQRPFATLEAAFKDLVGASGKAQALASRLVALMREATPARLGPLEMTVADGNRITLSLPAQSLAGVVRLSGTLGLDLATPQIDCAANLYNPALALTLAPCLSWRPLAAAPPAFTLKLAWGDGSKPAPEALTIVPFAADTFVQQVADLAPAYVLNMLTNMAVESKLLASYPLARQILQGLGMASEQDGAWTMPALLGLLRDPGGWLLSNGVLGSDGRFDVAGFVALLRKLPAATAGNGVSLTPTATGATLAGLPYGISVAFSGDERTASIQLTAAGIAVADNSGTLEKLSAGLTLGADYQPSVSGLIRASAAAGTSSAFFVEAGYDGGFDLALGTGGSDPIALQLVPFEGWGSLAEKAARTLAVTVLPELMPKLLDALDPGIAKRLREAGGKLQVETLVAAIAKVEPFTAEGIEKAALDWLLQRLSDANAQATAEAVVALLQGLVPGDIAAADGQVAYTPSAKLPLTLRAGRRTVGGRPLAGAWAELTLPPSLLQLDIAPTGIGVPLQGAPDPVLSFGVEARLPLEGAIGPQLALTYDGGLALTVDPLGGGGQASALSRQLLPQFFPPGQGQPADLAQRFEAWLLQLLIQVVPRYVAAVVLNQTGVHQWLTTRITAQGGPTPGQVLAATALLVDEGAPAHVFRLNSLDALSKITPQSFVANFLKTLLQTDLRLLTFGTGKQASIWIGPSPNDPSAYGVRLTAPDIAVPKLPNVVLQIGGEDSGWIAKAGGDVGKLPVGLSAYLPIHDDKPDITGFTLNLVNVGIDIVGKDNKPLLDLSRFKLGAVAPRSLVLLDGGGGRPKVAFGVAGSARDMALSLAPATLAAGGGGNPIAKNVLGSGSEQDGSGNPPVNPGFSVTAAYAGALWVELSSKTQSGPQIIIPVQRSFGPLSVSSLGLGWQQDAKLLQFAIGGGLALAGLKVGVEQLTVGIPVTTITDIEKYDIDLQGLDMSFQGGAVSISGGFVKVTEPYLCYTGAALIKASKFSIAAAGSYAELPLSDAPDARKAPSLFIFGALNAPLGGVPAFFITGIAAGFGYNRSLILPDIAEVQNFPLVSGVLNGTFAPDESPDSAMATLSSALRPALGQYWGAAGLKFTSFSLLEAFGLLSVEFGQSFRVGLTGLCYAALPPRVGRDYALAYVELGLKAVIDPSVGFVSVEAQLTPNSFVLYKGCRLTGGFAFYLWFKDIQTDHYRISAGDFVVSLGGYHPSFKKPAWYPDVPRLGFEVVLNAGIGSVSMRGGVYFALVPTAIMAGGYLSVSFDAGPLRAWLDAAVNFMIEWAPFYFEGDISVSVGVAFHCEVAGVSVTLSVHMGAALMLAGPPMHGYVNIDWTVISFTISFGDDETATSDNTLSWDAFADQFLPKEAPPPPAAGLAALAADDKQVVQPLKLTVASGRQQDADAATWTVKAVPFVLRAETAIPASRITDGVGMSQLAGTAVGVRPMAVTAALDAPLVVSIDDAAGQPLDLAKHGIGLTAAINGAAAALWSQQALDRKHAPPADDMILPNRLMGAVLDGTRENRLGGLPAFPLLNLQYDRGDPILLPFARTPPVPPAGRYAQDLAVTTLKRTIMAADVVTARNGIFAALRKAGMVAVPEADLAVMAASAELVLQAPPVLARPAVYQAAAVQGTARTPPPASPQAATATAQPQPPRLVASLRRYRSTAAPSRLGLMPRAASTGAWVEAARQPAAAPLRTRLSAAADTGISLMPGGVALWQVDTAAAHRLRASGGVALRLACFDRHGELLSDQHHTPGAGDPLVPAGTGLLALIGADAASAGLAGWQRDSMLVRLNPYYAAGEGCLVRTQNASRLRRNGRLVERGLIDAGVLLDGNTVLGLGNRRRSGWIETVFTAAAPVVAVAVTGAAVRVALAVGAAELQDVRPISQFAAGGATVLVFAGPDPQAAGLRVVVQAEDAEVRVLGVYAVALPPSRIAAAWPGLGLSESALDADGPVPAATRCKLDAPIPGATP